MALVVASKIDLYSSSLGTDPSEAVQKMTLRLKHTMVPRGAMRGFTEAEKPFRGIRSTGPRPMALRRRDDALSHCSLPSVNGLARDGFA